MKKIIFYCLLILMLSCKEDVMEDYEAIYTLTQLEYLYHNDATYMLNYFYLNGAKFASGRV